MESGDIPNPTGLNGGDTSIHSYKSGSPSYTVQDKAPAKVSDLASTSDSRTTPLLVVEIGTDVSSAPKFPPGLSTHSAQAALNSQAKPRDSLEGIYSNNDSSSRMATPNESRDIILSRPESPTNGNQVSSASLSSSSSSATLASEPPTAGPSRYTNASIITPQFPVQSEHFNSSHVPKRQRIPRACDSCRRKKIRCNLSTTPTDDKAQICANCHQSGLPCTFTKSPAKRGPNKGYIQQLEHRLAALESTVSNEPGAEGAGIGAGLSEPSQIRAYSSMQQSSDFKQEHPTLPPSKKPRFSEPLLQHGNHYHYQPSGMLPPTHPLSARTVTDEVWTRTAPPSHLSSNSFFLSTDSSSSSYSRNHDYHDYYRPSPYHSPSFAPDDTSQQKSTLPPISRLMSTLPPPSSGSWTPRGSPGPQQRDYQHENSRSGQYAPQGSHHRQRSVSNAELSVSASNNRNASSTYPNRARPHSLSTSTTSTQHSETTMHSAPLAYHYRAPSSRTTSVSPAFSSHETLGDGSSGQNASAGDHNGAESPRLWHEAKISPTGQDHNSIRRTRSPNAQIMPLLANLDVSAVRSLDGMALRKALFRTPALLTFAMLPTTKLEGGLGDCDYLIKAAYLLSTSSAHLTYNTSSHDDQQWQTDCSAIIGQCMVPTLFEKQGNDSTCNEIETLMLCYVDALRRGRLIAGILGAISGKLAILETMGLPCKRYQAVGILLAVWHTVGYSSRRMYFGTPATSGPEALYSALETDDPTLRAICMFTFSMDRMCRRYCQNGETFVPPESIELTRATAMSEQSERLPSAQLRLLSLLDSFLLTLNFAYNQFPGSLPSLEALERQRHHLYAIVNDADSSDLLRLLVGPHVLAMAACISLYCLAACREIVEAEQDADKKVNIKTLERDYLSILDALKHMTGLLSAPPEASILNSHTFADAGDMRLVYAAIARYVKKHISAMLLSSQEQVSAHSIIGSMHAVGYLGTILSCDSQE